MKPKKQTETKKQTLPKPAIGEIKPCNDAFKALTTDTQRAKAIEACETANVLYATWKGADKTEQKAITAMVRGFQGLARALKIPGATFID